MNNNFPPNDSNFSAGGPVPGRVSNADGASELADEANATGQGHHAEFSTKADPTVSDRGHESRPDLAAVEKFTEADLKLGAERALILKAVRPLMQYIHGEQKGLSQAQAAKVAGVSAATLNRLLKQFGHLPVEELTPERLAGKTAQSGRKSPWHDFAQIPDVQRRLHQLYLLTCGASSDYMSKDRRTGSASLALERFADDALCPADLSHRLRRGKFPSALMNVIRRITPEMEQRHRGAKHAGLNGTVTHRRTTVEILEDGSQHQIELGDWWVFDDMSDNQPNWFLGPDGQPMMGRQGLYAYDLRHHWLGLELIGTSRDSYTAAIILRFIRRLMQSLGKPRRGVVFERSVWEARAIAGYVLGEKGTLLEDRQERTGMADAEKKFLQDGLEALGIKVHYTYTPRGKEIEGGFNYLQRVVSTFSPKHINIGRHAGEFEQGAKNLRRANNGSHHPQDLGFAEMDARADVLEQGMRWINERRGFKDGMRDLSPNEAGRGIDPVGVVYPSLPALTDNDLAVFLPRKHELEINSQKKVTATVDGVPFDFCAPELFASVGAGYKVFVKFDDAEPGIGAALYNRERSSANWHGWQFGQFIGFAEFVPSVARFDFRRREDQDRTASDLKKRFNGFTRTAYRAVGMEKFRASTARDGKGNVAIVTASGVNETAQQRRPATDSPQAATIHAREIARRCDIPLADVND